MEINIEALFPYLVAMGLGMLIGLERERRQEEEIFAGIRTFPLIALLGALVQDQFPDLHIPALAVIGVLISISYYGKWREKGEVGTTSSVTAILIYFFGALTTLSSEALILSVVFSTVTLFLLTLKEPLHRFADTVDTDEMIATLKFALITLVVLPLLPNEDLSVLGGLNPQYIWLMVVLVSGIGFSAYLLSKKLGANIGIGLTGFLGGFISSTATSVSMAQQSSSENKLSPICSFAIILASITMFPRVLVEISVANPGLLKSLVLPVGAMFTVGLLPLVYLFYSITSETARPEEPELDNPFQIKQALLFGAFFALILLLADYANSRFGNRGMYVTALISGLMDVDAITLSIAKMEAEEEVSSLVARNGIIIGCITNTGIKIIISWLFGTRKVGLYVTLSLLLSMATGGIWLIWL